MHRPFPLPPQCILVSLLRNKPAGYGYLCKVLICCRTPIVVCTLRGLSKLVLVFLVPKPTQVLPKKQQLQLNWNKLTTENDVAVIYCISGKCVTGLKRKGNMLSKKPDSLGYLCFMLYLWFLPNTEKPSCKSPAKMCLYTHRHYHFLGQYVLLSGYFPVHLAQLR